MANSNDMDNDGQWDLRSLNLEGVETETLILELLIIKWWGLRSLNFLEVSGLMAAWELLI